MTRPGDTPRTYLEPSPSTPSSSGAHRFASTTVRLGDTDGYFHPQAIAGQGDVGDLGRAYDEEIEQIDYAAAEGVAPIGHDPSEFTGCLIPGEDGYYNSATTITVYINRFMFDYLSLEGSTDTVPYYMALAAETLARDVEYPPRITQQSWPGAVVINDLNVLRNGSLSYGNEVPVTIDYERSLWLPAGATVMGWYTFRCNYGEKINYADALPRVDGRHTLTWIGPGEEDPPLWGSL